MAQAATGRRWSGASMAVLVASLLVAGAGASPSLAAETAASQAELGRLAEQIADQEKMLEAQKKALIEQQRQLTEQQRQLEVLRAQLGILEQSGLRAAAFNLGGAGAAQPSSTGVQPVQEQGQQPVGEAPPDAAEERPEIGIIPEVGGILTRKGTVVVEPAIEYTHSSINRFVFQGFEVVDTVLIGIIEASDSDRDTLTASVSGRVGVTNRLELEARVPYVYRNDRADNTVISTGTVLSESATGSDIGDVEAAVHYQINDGLAGWPYFVGNLRVKSDTGEGPFDVDFDANGIAEELATGSGFWAVQPSVTVLYPNDPVVFFGNLGYTVNFPDDVDRTIAGTAIGRVDPGDSINSTLGMGFSLNERTSFSLGFSYDYIFGTEQEQNGVDVESNDLRLGSLLAGWAYQVSDDVGINLNFRVGATEDAPDFQTQLRVPIRFDVF